MTHRGQRAPQRSVPIVEAPNSVAHVWPFGFPTSHCSPPSIVPLPQTAAIGLGCDGCGHGLGTAVSAS
jgi:hypothetical protein